MKLIITFLSFCLFNISNGQNWMQSQILDRKFNQAVSNYNGGKFTISEKIILEILSGEPGVYKEPSLLLLLKNEIALNKPNKAKDSANKFLSEFSESDYLPNVLESLGDLYVNEAKYASAYRMYHQALSQISIDRKNIQEKLFNLVKIQLPISLIDEMMILTTKIESKNIHLIARANSELLNGDPDAAAVTLSKVNKESLNPIYNTFYNKLLEASYRPSLNLLTVGLILPLSGKGSEIANAFLKGFYAGELSLNSENQRLSTIVMDSKSIDINAVKISQNLEEMNLVSGIVCELDAPTTLAVVSALSSTDIPVILSNYRLNDLSKIHKKVFLTHSTIEIDAINTARYAINNLGLDSLAIIAPANIYGETQVDAFIKEVDRLGANVVATEWYSGEPKNLQRQFKFIRKIGFDLLSEEKSFDEALGMEIDSLDALFDVSVDDYFDLPQTNKKKMTSSDSSKVILKTIQGLYLPIGSGEAEFLGTQIPMYNLDTRVFGNSNWQDLKILKKENIGPHLKGLSILTNFHIPANDTVDYNSELQRSYFRGYNTAQLLLKLSIKENNRNGLYDSLIGENFINGEGFFFVPSSINKNVNSASQILEFNGTSFLSKGLFHSDSLHNISLENQ